jgi:lipopolysaccharide transport system ATP-binding protein
LTTAQAIVVRDLGKEYALGSGVEVFQYDLLRDTVTAAAASLLRRRRNGDAASRGKPTRFWALKNVNFSVPAGQVVGIVGRNGAGKSTLLKILSRITRPTEGVADMFGRVGSLLEVGTGFHPELTGRENIFLNGAILGMRRAEIARSFDAIVDFSGVAPFLDTPVKRYSSGMYVRLAFAVAAHLETEILLVDEVLAVGDAEFQRKCLDKMRSVVHQGRTVLFVSHNMSAVKSLCERAVWIDRGQVTRDGRVDEVVDAYLAAGLVRSETGVIAEDIPRSGSGEARITRVDLLDGRGAPTGQIYMGDPFSVALTFEVREPLRDVVIGVGISSLDGVRATSSYSTDGGAPPISFEPGRHRVVLDLNLVLLPRRYALDLLISRMDGYEVDYLQQAVDFTALDVAREGPDGYRWPTVHGYVRPAGRWHLPERSVM